MEHELQPTTLLCNHHRGYERRRGPNCDHQEEHSRRKREEDLSGLSGMPREKDALRPVSPGLRARAPLENIHLPLGGHLGLRLLSDWNHFLSCLLLHWLISERGSDGSKGPPCRRCSQVKIECVLVNSRRGGARTRESTANATRAASRPVNFAESPAANGLEPFQAADPATWASPRDQREPSTTGEWQRNWPGPPAGSPASTMSRRTSRVPTSIENHLNTKDLLNPSDALDLLAEVADRNAEGRNSVSQITNPNTLHLARTTAVPASIVYGPIVDGFLTGADASHLLGL